MKHLVLYLHEIGERHRGHPLSIGHTGPQGADLIETDDGGIALPVGARVVSVTCLLCNEAVAVRPELKEEVTPLEQSDPSRDPWYQDPEGWKG